MAIISSVAAVLICAVIQPVPAHGQLPPWLPCLANITKSNVGPPVQSWVTGPPAGWQYTWNWSVDYDCSNNQYSRCDVDEAVSVSIDNPATGDYDPPIWHYYCSNNYKNCGSNWVANYTTTSPFPGGWAPGTVFMIVFSAAAHDPNVQDCDKQDYQLLDYQVVITRSTPP